MKIFWKSIHFCPDFIDDFPKLDLVAFHVDHEMSHRNKVETLFGLY